MKKYVKHTLLALILLLSTLIGCGVSIEYIDETDEIYFEEGYQEEDNQEVRVQEDGLYTSKEEVAAYIYLYDHLPDNYITKKEAKELGWVSSEGNLGEVAPGKSIGGDYLGTMKDCFQKMMIGIITNVISIVMVDTEEQSELYIPMMD